MIDTAQPGLVVSLILSSAFIALFWEVEAAVTLRAFKFATPVKCFTHELMVIIVC